MQLCIIGSDKKMIKSQEKVMKKRIDTSYFLNVVTRNLRRHSLYLITIIAIVIIIVVCQVYTTNSASR